jgi:hypothetical protein
MKIVFIREKVVGLALENTLVFELNYNFVRNHFALPA